MQAALVEFGSKERARLAAGMEHKKVTVCEDETPLAESWVMAA